MKRSRALFPIVVFLCVVLAPMTAGANTCPGDDPAVDEAHKLATLQAEGQPMILDAVHLDAFARASLQAEGQVMVSPVITNAGDQHSAIAAYELGVLQAQGQVYIPVILASCGSSG